MRSGTRGGHANIGARIICGMPVSSAFIACQLCNHRSFHEFAPALPADGSQQAVLGPTRRRTRRPAPKQRCCPTQLVEIPATCLAAPKMQPHRDTGAERRGALHVVGGQFAHVATCRHAVRPFCCPSDSEETRRGTMRYGVCAVPCRETSPPGSVLHASDRVRRAGIPGSTAPRRGAGLSKPDPPVPLFPYRGRGLDHRQPRAGRGGGPGCLARGLRGHRPVRGPLQPGDLGVQHRAEPRAHPSAAGRDAWLASPP